MAEKGMFVKFMGALKKHFKVHYPFVKQLEKSLDLSMPKSSCFYLGVSPRYNKHVIVKFLHESKPWNVGQFSIYVHISSQFELTKNFSPSYEQYEFFFKSFDDGIYYAPPLLLVLGKGKNWCLKPTTKNGDSDMIYWKPSSYDSDEIVIQEAIADVCSFLEILFKKAGFIAEDAHGTGVE